MDPQQMCGQPGGVSCSCDCYKRKADILLTMPRALCETCMNGPECVQVARGLTESIAERGGWLRDGRPCGRYVPENKEDARGA